MAGHTGRRAKTPGRCFRCGGKIQDSTFERDSRGDSHSMSADGKHHCVSAASATKADREFEKAFTPNKYGEYA